MADKELDKTPLYVPFVSGYRRYKTADGIEEADTATLRRYYSSIDAEIYFNNEYVEDICDINWSVQQRHMPIFGFNSYTYDDIAVGARMVTGTFAIRFTSPNYLFKLLEVAQTATVSQMSSYTIPVHDRILGEPDGKVDESLSGEVAGTNHKELWPETFDIDVVFGKPSWGGKEVHVILLGVRILSCTSGASSSSPVPTTEQYQFVANDIKTLA